MILSHLIPPMKTPATLPYPLPFAPLMRFARSLRSARSASRPAVRSLVAAGQIARVQGGGGGLRDDGGGGFINRIHAAPAIEQRGSR